MEKRLLLLLFIVQGLFFTASGQEPRRQQQTLQGQQHYGYSLKVPYAEHNAKRYWLAYLKERGKVTERRQFIEIKDIYWLDSGAKQQALSTVAGDSAQSEVWIGYPSTTRDSVLEAGIKEQLQKLPFLMKKYQLMASLQDAEGAATYLNREVESTRRQESKLENSLRRNAEEKLRLEQQLVKNGEDKLRLEQEIKDNKLKQEQQQAEVEKINRQLQALKEKLSQLQE
ncbi:hypothetical protein [Cesiribacter sp. SM1]|uniref:hypothetical protein n=1 Tax=Cesiribacter sp. SM1 TaxID=2861196 RepID=UPI001CD55B87|nr:hypothetical protein [Cesiribacter sp. SM1]